MPRHHLQRLVSPSPSASLLLHLLGVATLGKSFHSLFIWDTPFAQAYGWYLQFLTIIGLALSLSVFVLAAIADVSGGMTLFRLKNLISIAVTPLEVLISALYWGICVIDTSLIVPPGYEIDIWADAGFHLAPAAFLTLDFILFSPPWTVSAYGMMSLSAVFAFAYWCWVEVCFSKNGWYPYPIFGLLNTTQRALLFALSACLVTLLSGLLKWTHGLVNGNDRVRREAHKPSKKIQ